MQYITIQYNTIQFTNNKIQYNTIQYNTIQYNTIQYNTIQYNTIQYNTIQYNIITIQYSDQYDLDRGGEICIDWWAKEHKWRIAESINLLDHNSINSGL